MQLREDSMQSLKEAIIRCLLLVWEGACMWVWGACILRPVPGELGFLGWIIGTRLSANRKQDLSLGDSANKGKI